MTALFKQLCLHYATIGIGCIYIRQLLIWKDIFDSLWPWLFTFFSYKKCFNDSKSMENVSIMQFSISWWSPNSLESLLLSEIRAPDKVHIIISIVPVPSLNPMFDHFLESSHWDDSNRWLNVGFGEELTQGVSIEDKLMHLI